MFIYYATLDNRSDKTSFTGVIFRFDPDRFSHEQWWPGDGWVTNNELLVYTHGDDTGEATVVTPTEAARIGKIPKTEITG